MRKKTEEKRQDILRGAGRVFQSQGYQGSTLNDVAREVGCSKVTIYNYFSSRDELLKALIVEGARPTMEYLKSLLEGGANPFEERLSTFAKIYLGLVTHEYSIAMLRLMVAQGGDQDFTGEFSPGASFDIWASVRAAFKREADKIIPEPSLDRLTHHLRTMLHGGSHYQILIGASSSASPEMLADEAEKAVELVLTQFKSQ